MVNSPGFIVLALVFLGAVVDCYTSNYNVQRSLGVPLTLFATSLLFASAVTNPLQPQTIDPKSASAAAEPGLKPRGEKLGTVVETPGLDDDEKRALRTMSDWVATSFQHGLGSPLSVDDMTATIMGYQKYPGSRHDVQDALEKALNMSDDDMMALQRWLRFYKISSELEDALAKIPMTTGVVFRSTFLSTETVEMLNELQAGQYSKGQRGIYEVQDLVLNEKTEILEGSDFPRKVMATSLDFAPNPFFNVKHYRFIINSKSGRYIDGLVAGLEREVLFYQGMAGKFKLIGRQDINGGEEAKKKANPLDRHRPWAVYYFDEVEVPAPTVELSVDDVEKAIKEELGAYDARIRAKKQKLGKP